MDDILKGKSIHDGKIFIDTLPNELLAYIFELGVQMKEQDVSGRHSKKPAESSASIMLLAETSTEHPNLVNTPEVTNGVEPPSISEPLDHELQVVASHVCSRWRKCALSTPTLWTYIDMSEGPPYLKTKEWLLRSKEAPLEIDLDFTNPDYEEQDDSDDEDESADPYWIEEEVLEAISIILPYIERWREVDFHGESYVLIRLFMSLLEGKGAPMLTRLVLNDVDQVDEGGELHQGEPSHPGLPLFKGQGSTPNLRLLSLYSVPTDWSTHFWGSRGLTVLELAYHTTEQQPTINQFVAMLESSLSLEHLVLRSSGPSPEPIWRVANPLVVNPDFSRAGAAMVASVPLLQLTFLSLAEFSNSTDVSNLVELVYCPNLQKLHLKDLWENEDEERVDLEPVIWGLSLSQPISPRNTWEDVRSNLKPRYPKLKELSLLDIYCSSALAYASMFHLSSQLTRLNLARTNVTLMWNALACFFNDRPPRYMEVSWTELSPHLAWLKDLYGVACPLLEGFSYKGWPVKKLIYFAEVRKSVGKPLRAMELYESDNSNAKRPDVDRLMELVQELTIHGTSSSSESDDLED